jgi:hypothetical protein
MSGKLNILLEQRTDLSTAIDDLLTDIENGAKFMKVYKQMKMYNDNRQFCTKEKSNGNRFAKNYYIAVMDFPMGDVAMTVPCYVSKSISKFNNGDFVLFSKLFLEDCPSFLF